MDVRLLFQTVDEDQAPMDAKVTGNIPDWIKGTFLRVGAGRYELGDFKVKYWLDGYSLLSAFHIDGNKVKFQRRYLQSDAAKKGLQAKKPLFTEFGTRAYADPSKNMFSRMVNSLVPGDLTDNCNLNAYQIGDQTIAATETCFCRLIDPRTLETKDKLDLSKSPAKVNITTCHPHIAPDGTVYNIGCNFLSGLKYTVYKTPPNSNGAHVLDDSTMLCQISPSWKTSYGYFHSFGLTENYLVLIEQPLLVNSLKLVASKAQGKSLKDCMEWTPEEKTKFFILDRNTGQRLTTRYTAPALFFLHLINSYEESDQIVVDMITFKSSELFESFNLENANSGSFKAADISLPKRFVIPLPTTVDRGEVGANLVTLKNTKATAEKLKDGSVFCTPDELFEVGIKGGFDFPKINYKRSNGRPYRYAYGSGFFESGITKNSLVKGDTMTRQITTWNAGDDFYCGDPTFIESPNAKDEDDGVLVSGVCSARPDKEDYLVVLDAKTLKELGRASVPVRITPGIHSTFIPK